MSSIFYIKFGYAMEGAMALGIRKSPFHHLTSDNA